MIFEVRFVNRTVGQAGRYDIGLESAQEDFRADTAVRTTHVDCRPLWVADVTSCQGVMAYVWADMGANRCRRQYVVLKEHYCSWLASRRARPGARGEPRGVAAVRGHRGDAPPSQAPPARAPLYHHQATAQGYHRLRPRLHGQMLQIRGHDFLRYQVLGARRLLRVDGGCEEGSSVRERRVRLLQAAPERRKKERGRAGIPRCGHEAAVNSQAMPIIAFVEKKWGLSPAERSWLSRLPLSFARSALRSVAVNLVAEGLVRAHVSRSPPSSPGRVHGKQWVVPGLRSG